METSRKLTMGNPEWDEDGINYEICKKAIPYCKNSPML